MRARLPAAAARQAFGDLQASSIATSSAICNSWKACAALRVVRRRLGRTPPKVTVRPLDRRRSGRSYGCAQARSRRGVSSEDWRLPSLADAREAAAGVYRMSHVPPRPPWPRPSSTAGSFDPSRLAQAEAAADRALAPRTPNSMRAPCIYKGRASDGDGQGRCLGQIGCGVRTWFARAQSTSTPSMPSRSGYYNYLTYQYAKAVDPDRERVDRVGPGSMQFALVCPRTTRLRILAPLMNCWSESRGAGGAGHVLAPLAVSAPRHRSWRRGSGRSVPRSHPAAKGAGDGL